MDFVSVTIFNVPQASNSFRSGVFFTMCWKQGQGAGGHFSVFLFDSQLPAVTTCLWYKIDFDHQVLDFGSRFLVSIGVEFWTFQEGFLPLLQRQVCSSYIQELTAFGSLKERFGELDGLHAYSAAVDHLLHASTTKFPSLFLVSTQCGR